MKFVLLISVVCSVLGSFASAASLDHSSEVLAIHDFNSVKTFISLKTGDDPTPEFLVEFGRKAIQKQRHDVLDYLVNNFKSPSLSGKFCVKNCLLQFALDQNDLESVKILIAAGLPIDGSLYKTPLIWAVEGGRSLDIIRFLVESGADPLAVDASGKCAIDYADELSSRASKIREYLSSHSK